MPEWLSRSVTTRRLFRVYYAETIQTGVDGLDIVIGTSHFLREYSHGKDMAYITKTAIEVVEFVKSKGLEVRCEILSRTLRNRILIAISLQ